MKVAIVTAATNTIRRFRLEMAEEFVRRGCEVLVLGDEPEKKWDEFFSGKGMQYLSYPVSRNGTNPVQDLRTQKALQNIFENEMPDKVFTYQAKPNIYGNLAAQRAGIPEMYALVAGLGSVFRSNDFKSRAIGCVVSWEYRLALRHVKKVFFQNRDDVAEFIRRGITTEDKVVMLHGSGVNTEAFAQVPLPETPTFVLVGRLVRGKGVFEYLEAARIVRKEIPEARFLLVGPFDTNPTSLTPEDLAPYEEDGTVQYLGELEDVRPALTRASAFCLPSYYGEGTPKSALEAMSMGRPVVMADAVGSREVVVRGANGILVPPRDAVALAAALMLLAKDPSLTAQMGAESRRLAEELFDVRKVNDVICETMGIPRMTTDSDSACKSA